MKINDLVIKKEAENRNLHLPQTEWTCFLYTPAIRNRAIPHRYLLTEFYRNGDFINAVSEMLRTVFAGKCQYRDGHGRHLPNQNLPLPFPDFDHSLSST